MMRFSHTHNIKENLERLYQKLSVKIGLVEYADYRSAIGFPKCKNLFIGFIGWTRESRSNTKQSFRAIIDLNDPRAPQNGQIADENYACLVWT